MVTPSILSSIEALERDMARLREQIIAYDSRLAEYDPRLKSANPLEVTEARVARYRLQCDREAVEQQLIKAMRTRAHLDGGWKGTVH